MNNETESMSSRTAAAPALERGLQALALLKQRELSLEEISRDLSLPKSSMSRIMGTLEAWNYVTRSPLDKKYSLSVQIIKKADLNPSEIEYIQTELNDLSNESASTAEWYTLGTEFAELILRSEAKENAVYIKAKLGFPRYYQDEFEAVNRIAHAFGDVSVIYEVAEGTEAAEGAERGDQEADGEYWIYQSGHRKPLSSRDIEEQVRQTEQESMAIDVEYNSNGVRRAALPVFNPDHSLKGVLALSEHFHPLADEQRAIKIKFLKETASNIERFLKKED